MTDNHRDDRKTNIGLVACEGKYERMSTSLQPTIEMRYGLAAGRHDFGASPCMRCEHAVVAQHAEPRRWAQGDEPRDEIEQLEYDGVRTVSPGSLALPS